MSVNLELFSHRGGNKQAATTAKITYGSTEAALEQPIITLADKVINNTSPTILKINKRLKTGK